MGVDDALLLYTYTKILTEELPNLSANTPGNKVICYSCIQDQELSAQTKQNDRFVKCSYCQHTFPSICISDLACKIDDVMQRDFVYSPRQPQGKIELLRHRAGMWVRRGQSPREIVSSIAGVSDAIATDVCAFLSTLESNRHMELETDENPFGDDARYLERKPLDLHFHEPWYRLRLDILSRKKPCNDSAEDVLNAIFEDLDDCTTFGNRPIMVEFGPDSADYDLWRGRRASTREKVVEILDCPSRQLGPPSRRDAKANRMNPAGIPMFYGATDKYTSVSEVRPVVGGFVVVGKFKPLCKLRILDLDALTEIQITGSRFDPEYPKRRSRAAFLKRFVREIGKPVLPEDETLGYLTAQLVAKFFADEFDGGVDGMIYRSSQSAGDGRNIVLFNHASQVKPIDCCQLPEKYLVTKYPNDDDNEQWKILVDLTGDGKNDACETCHQNVNEGVDQRDSSIELDLCSVEVHSVTGVKYQTERVKVDRFRRRTPSQWVEQT